ncbi:MAG: hypothetical protein NVSMB19_06930 [Vulcanimicrobiaceae bacterium]
MSSSTESWSIAWSLGIGIGAILIGFGVLVLCLRAGALLTRIGRTLDEIDRQIPVLSAPIATTLTHVGGIADTADITLARFGVAVGQLEGVAANASRTASTLGTMVSSAAASWQKPKPDVRPGESI